MIDGMNAGGRATKLLRPPANEYSQIQFYRSSLRSANRKRSFVGGTSKGDFCARSKGDSSK
jgi:hypothetical protein